MSKRESKVKTRQEGKQTEQVMTAEKAGTIILSPYITEKTFNLIERENKLTFIVSEQATKKEIMDAIELLYESVCAQVNTARTIQGKKAFVEFQSPEAARDLATKLGLV